MPYAFATEYLYLAGSFDVLFWLLAAVAVTGTSVRVIAALINPKEDPKLLVQEDSFMTEQEHARRLRGLWRDLAKEKGYEYTPGVPEFGRLQGEQKQLEWAVTGLVDQEGEHYLAMTKVGVRGPHHVSMLLHTPTAMDHWLQSFIPYELQTSEAITPFAGDDQTAPVALSASETNKWKHELRRHWGGPCGAYHNDLLFPWRLPITHDGSILHDALVCSLDVAERFFRNAEKNMGERLATAYREPKGLRAQLNAGLLLTCFYQNHKACHNIAMHWLAQWHKEWYPGQVTTPAQQFNVLWNDPQGLYLHTSPHQRRVWFELTMTLLKDLIVHDTNESLPIEWSRLYRIAVAEDLTDRGLIYQQFAQVCKQFPDRELKRWLESEELLGPKTLLGNQEFPEAGPALLKLRAVLWKAFLAKAGRLAFIQELCSHCRSDLEHCRDEGYTLVNTELSHHEQVRWSHMIFDLGTTESWFECLEFLDIHNSSALEGYRAELLQHPLLSDDEQKKVLASMDDNGSSQSFTTIHKMLEAGKFSFTVKGTAKKVYEKIKERLGQETAGGLTLVDDIDNQGKLSVADHEEGKLSLE